MPQTAPEIIALAESLRPAVLHVSRRLRQAGQRTGLSAQDVLVLVQVRKQPGIGVSALADAERISRPTMSAQVKRLEASGLLARSEHDSDGRRSGLSITPAGANKLVEIRQQRNDWLVERLARLSPEERDLLAQAAPALERLADL
ncbi:MAG: MarR family transcriptional regulator [Phenylobacterium sp.]|nr:MarR family transcriptional regulator [Phenylobacterium sp.]